ncbi:MAG: hypothetical protein ABIH77_01150 [Pseudomonadota bacterium]
MNNCLRFFLFLMFILLSVNAYAAIHLTQNQPTKLGAEDSNSGYSPTTIVTQPMPQVVLAPGVAALNEAHNFFNQSDYDHFNRYKPLKLFSIPTLKP